MAFWSGETLKLRLTTLITEFDDKRVDCAAYRLRLGDQIFVTSDEVLDGRPRSGLIHSLDKSKRWYRALSKYSPDAIRIPPGQFAFLLTEEEVTVPSTAIAWISIRATYKFRGLVNVSGFHVDPGWRGKLIFSVYNAGPAAVHLKRGEDLFLILYSDLDQDSAETYKGDKTGQRAIPSDLVSNMSGQVFSPMHLEREVRNIRGTLEKIQVVAGILLTIMVAVIGYFIKETISLKEGHVQIPTVVNNISTANPVTSDVKSNDERSLPIETPNASAAKFRKLEK